MLPGVGNGVALESMTNNGYQVVMDMQKHIKNGTGDGNELDHYKSLRGQDKLELALQLNVDRSAAFMPATEHYGRDVSQSSTLLEGLVTEAHVALRGGLC